MKSVDAARLRALFDAQSRPIWLLDRSDTVLDSNAAASALDGDPGAARDEAGIADLLEHLAGPSDRARLLEGLEALHRGGTARVVFDEVPLGTAGLPHDVALTRVDDIPDLDGAVLLEACPAPAVREQASRERAMLRSLAAIGESASLLAHEIKAPLTALNLALRAVSTNLGHGEQALIEDLLRRLQRLRQLMGTTLSLAGPIDLALEPTDLGTLARATVDALRPSLDAQRIEVVTSIEPDCPPVPVDAGAVSEVLTNLLSNAMDAVGQGGRIEVRLGREGDALCLVVDDDGPGIPPGEQDRIFRPFITTKADGTGLGLALARKFTEGHGGSLVAGRSDGGGARFLVRLPCES